MEISTLLMEEQDNLALAMDIKELTRVIDKLGVDTDLVNSLSTTLSSLIKNDSDFKDIPVENIHDHIGAVCSWVGLGMCMENIPVSSRELYEMTMDKMVDKDSDTVEHFRQYVKDRRHQYEYPDYEYTDFGWHTPDGFFYNEKNGFAVVGAEHLLVTYFRHYFMWDNYKKFGMGVITSELTTDTCLKIIREVFSV